MALGGIGCGTFGGAAVITGGMIVLRSYQLGLPAPPDGTAQGGFEIIWGSLMAGLITAAAGGWILSRPINDTWRRGVIATVGGMSALLVGAVSAPVDAVAGRPGLSLWLLVLVAAMVYSYRRARQAGTAP